MKIKKPPYVHAYQDRLGKPRIYFKKPYQPNIALPGPLFSEAFWVAYHKAKDMLPDVKNEGAGAEKTKAGSFDALIVEYYGSADFTPLAEETRRSYRNLIELFRKDYGHLPVATISTKHIDGILGKVAARSSSQAHHLRKRLLKLMQLAVRWGYRTDNPMLMAGRVKHKTVGYRTWTEGDIDRFRATWGENTPQRLAFEILLYTGLRRSDAVRLGRQHIQGSNLVLTTKKSGHTTELQIPIHDDFRKIIDATKPEHLNFIVTSQGASRSEKAFSNWIGEAADKAGLPSNSSPHGLRKAACRRLAEAGCTAHEIMSITGHKNLAEVETYCREANKKTLAASAIAKLKVVK